MLYYLYVNKLARDNLISIKLLFKPNDKNGRDNQYYT